MNIDISIPKNDNETWKEAFERFHAFCRVPFQMYDDEPETTTVLEFNRNVELLIPGKRIPAERLAELEAKYNVTIPMELKKFMQEHGSFTIKLYHGNDLDLLHFYNPADSAELAPFLPEIKPFLMGLENNFTYEIKDDLLKCSMTQEQIDWFNNNCFFFGHIIYNDERWEYLYFDKQGNFSSLYFAVENVYSTVKDHVLPALEGITEPKDFNQIMSYAIDKVMEWLTEYISEE